MTRFFPSYSYGTPSRAQQRVGTGGFTEYKGSASDGGGSVRLSVEDSPYDAYTAYGQLAFSTGHADEVISARMRTYQDIYDDYKYIHGLLEDRELVIFIMGNETKNVYVSGVAYNQGDVFGWSESTPRQYSEGGRRDRWVEGILTVQLISVQTGVDLVPVHASSTG